MRVDGGRMGSRDQFPIGMRVLAVDDDPVCLKLLETLLLKCNYHVTTTNQAITALKLLRENKDKFDLVISDVHMPDMDGFMLLERVGLEMDLPVIMLSANGDTKTVMKGVTHGACDYLLKPVRLEELQNVWQHVIRRKSKEKPTSTNNNNNSINIDDSDGEKEKPQNFQQGQNGNSGKKRKEQNNEGEEEDGEDNEDNDPTAQKKPRVVWSVDLHRKFVAAVHQLGIDKAVPKRILELMNVEKLTRENVASHLQKYRLYLKRLSAVASQQASLVAAFGGRSADPSAYLRMGMFEGLQSYHPLASSSSLPPFQPTINNPLNFPSSSLPVNNPLVGSSNALSEINKFQIVSGNANQVQGGLIDSLPNEFSFSNVGSSGGNSNNLLAQKGAEMIGNSFPAKNIGVIPPFENRCVTRGESNRPLEISIPSSSNLINICDSSNINMNNNSSEDLIIGRDIKCESSLFREDPKILSFSTGGNSVQNSVQKANWRQQDDLHESSLLLSSYLESQIPINANNSCNSLSETNPVFTNNSNNNGNTLVERFNGGYLSQRANTIAPSGGLSGLGFLPNCQSQVKQRDDYGLMVSKVQNGFGPTGCNFDGLLNSMIKLERDEISFSDGDLGCDFYPLGAHM
ncbi:hypothetical protein LUZ60_000934 [Juncus effusus]|nr:hypothetical protein LUZ60_000934 [Juncus effusus]